MNPNTRILHIKDLTPETYYKMKVACTIRQLSLKDFITNAIDREISSMGLDMIIEQAASDLARDELRVASKLLASEKDL